jgi:broad-specificity NMP kinase
MVCDDLESEMAAGGIILEFHTSGFFPERWFGLVVLLRVNNTVLYDRLQERGYNEKKIKENIECEIMEVTSEEVYESYNEGLILSLVNEELEQMEANIGQIIERIEGET